MRHPSPDTSKVDLVLLHYANLSYALGEVSLEDVRHILHRNNILGNSDSGLHL